MQDMGKIEFINANRDAAIEELKTKFTKLLHATDSILDKINELQESIERTNRKIKGLAETIYAIDRQLAYSKTEQIEKFIRLLPIYGLATFMLCFSLSKVFGYFFS